MVALPSALPDDGPAIVRALRKAATAWNADRADSVAWIRHAAHEAEVAGRTERAIELALAAAELAEQLMSSSVLPTARKYDMRAPTREFQSPVKKR